MREDVAHDAGGSPPCHRFSRPGKARRLFERMRLPSKSFDHSVVGTSVMPPRRPFGRPRAQQHTPSARRTTKAAPRRNSPSRLASGAESFGVAARVAPRSFVPGHKRARRRSSACRWWRRDPSSPGQNRRRGVAASARAPACAISGFAAGNGAVDARTAARRRARYCRRPGLPAHRRRSPRSRRPCKRRCREVRATRFRSPEIFRHAARPRRARRHADCGRGRNSRARPRP